MNNDDLETLNLKKLKIKKILKQYIWITFGVFLLNLAFFFFLDPAEIVTGGMMGVSIIVEPYLLKIGSWFTPSIFLYIVNGICLILGLVFLGKDFFLKTIYATLVQPSILFVFERTMNPNFFYDTITDGNQGFICLICSSILAGLGIGIAVKYNGSTGGMDVIQKIISKYFKVPMSTTMYVTDAIIVLYSGFSFNPFTYNIERVVLGVSGVIAVGFIVDFVALSLKPRRTMYVITKNPELIKDLIYKNLDRGVTFNKVIGGYTGDEQVMVICTMDKNEAYRMTSIVAEEDPKAFTFVTSCKEVRGEYEKRGLL